MADDRSVSGAKQSLTKADKAIQKSADGLTELALKNTLSMGEASKEVSKTVADMIALEKQKQLDAKTLQNNIKITAAAQGLSVESLNTIMQENELVIDKASGELVKFKDSTQAFEDSIVKMNGVVKKDFKDAGDAIKELSGGIIDLNQYFGNGMDKVNAAMTLVTTPFKALNSVIVSTSSFFGKEFNPGQTMLDWWQGTEEEMKQAGKDGTTGFKGVLSAGFDKFVESGKELGGKLVELAKRSPAENIEAAKESFATFGPRLKEGVLALGRGLAGAARGMIAGGLSLLTAIVPVIISSAVFVAGLIATGATMLAAGIAAAAPAILIAIGIAALIAGIVLIVKNFEAIKTTVKEKFTAMVDKVKGIFTSIVDKIKDIGQMVKDWIREKILGLKSWLPGGLSKEEEQELKDIEKRKEERAKAKDKEQKVFEETEKINEEALKNKENLTEKEKENIKLESEQQARTEIAKEEKSLAQLRKEEEKLQQKADIAMSKSDRKAQTEQQIKDRVARDGSVDLTKYEGMEELKEKYGDTIDASNVDAFAKDRAESIFGTDEQIKADEESAMNALVDKQFEIKNKEREIGLDDPNAEIEASQVLSKREIFQAKEEKYRKSLGMSKEEFEAKKDEEIGKELDTLYDGYEGPEYQSEFLAGVRDTELSAADIRAKAQAVDEEKTKGMEMKSTGDVTTGNVNQQINQITQTSIKDPAPHNPDPTGSRLSVVPS